MKPRASTGPVQANMDGVGGEWAGRRGTRRPVLLPRGSPRRRFRHGLHHGATWSAAWSTGPARLMFASGQFLNSGHPMISGRSSNDDGGGAQAPPSSFVSFRCVPRPNAYRVRPGPGTAGERSLRERGTSTTRGGRRACRVSALGQLPQSYHDIFSVPRPLRPGRNRRADEARRAIPLHASLTATSSTHR